MDYRLQPFGEIWSEGIFNVPSLLVDKYLKTASEYQLKALLFILRNGGKSSSSQIAKALGHTQSDIDDLLEYWVIEGVLSAGENSPVNITEPKAKPAHEVKAEEKPAPAVKETMSAPRLTPKDIVNVTRDDRALQILLSQAQVVLGRTISHAEQEMLVNMVHFYGLKVEIILMILEYYRAEKEKGKSIGVSYINTMAKNWSEEGIETIAQAEEKLEAIARNNRRWIEITNITGIRHRKPTAKQSEMVESWFADFDITMITLASDIMKENIPEPKLAYMNTILKKWKKLGITSPSDVKAQQAEFEKQKDSKKNDKLQSKPSYDLEKIKRDAMNNTDI